MKIAIYKKKTNQSQLFYIKNMTYNVKKTKTNKKQKKHNNNKKQTKNYICLKCYINPT